MACYANPPAVIYYFSVLLYLFSMAFVYMNPPNTIAGMTIKQTKVMNQPLTKDIVNAAMNNDIVIINFDIFSPMAF